MADRRGRKPTVIVGALLAAVAGALYFVPAGIPGLIVARFFLGAGEGTVFTAGSAWNVDMAPEGAPRPHDRPLRPRHLDRAHARTPDRRAAPARRWLRPRLGLRGGRPAARRRDRLQAARALRRRPRSRPRPVHLARGARARASPSRSASSASPRSPPSSCSASTSAASATARRSSASSPRRWSRPGSSRAACPTGSAPARCAVGAALIETAGLILLGAADSLAVVIVGAIGMGAAFSLLFPSLSLVAINRVGPERRGRGDGHLHRQLRPGHAGRLAAGRRGRGDRRLQRGLLRRGASPPSACAIVSALDVTGGRQAESRFPDTLRA